MRPAPDCIWSGLMHCDFIPLLGNESGDWLCIRIDDRGHTDEIVHWYHGGGDWIPWGKNLAEAVLLDSVFDRLPGPSRRHAEPAEQPRRPTRSTELGPIHRWALEHLPPVAESVFQSSDSGNDLAQQLVDSEIAEIAVRCEWIIERLMLPERETILATLSDEYGTKRTAEWLFDPRRLPEAQRDQLEVAGVRVSDGQLWDLATRHSRRVIELAPELAWPWDLCGYAAERHGENAAAVDLYERAAVCSVFTDQSVRLETHWASDVSAKFAVSRLHELAPDLVQGSDYYRALSGPDTKARRSAVTDYWLQQASHAEADDDHGRALDCLIASAWDVGVDSIERYASVLDRIQHAAERAGQPARAELAATHHRCLLKR